MKAFIIIISFLFLPFYSHSQGFDFYEAFRENIRAEFFKYSSKEKLLSFDTVIIYGYTKTNETFDSTLISKIFIGKPIDTNKVVTNKRGFVRERGQRGVAWLYSDKNFNSKGQLILNTLYFNDVDVCCRIKYTYRNKDTLSITKYLLTTNDIFEQSIFKYNKNIVEKIIYDYNSCITTNSIKKDRFNRTVYTEYCYCDNPYSIKKYYTYSDSTLTIKTECPFYYEAEFYIDTYKYNELGLIESKTNKIINRDPLPLVYHSQVTEFYDLIKFFYK